MRRSRRRTFFELLEPRILLAVGNSPPVISSPISDLTLEAGDPFAFDLQPVGAVVFGFEAGGTDIVATDNYFTGSVNFLDSWQEVTFTGNTVFNESPYRVAQISDSPIGGALDQYTWDNNTYVTDTERPFIIDGSSQTLDQWLTQTGFDVSSTFTESISGTHVRVIPNEYELGRGHAVVYNWDRLDFVDLDLSAVVEVGATYEIYNVLNLKGAPVVSGTYGGATVSLPMTDVTSPIPIGYDPVAPLVVDKEFGSFLIVSDAAPAVATGNEFFVSTSGTPQGDGSLSDPWDLQTAMGHPAVVSPGDTISVFGGTYVGDFTSILTGTETNPIVVREWPGDEVIIDLNNGSPLRSEIITIEGQHTHYQGFEVFSSDLTSRTTTESGSWPDGINRGNINVFGDHVKLINWEIHDLNKGIGFWSAADGGEVYGSLIYNNGWSGPDREHGHGIYSQNEDFTRRFADNILFNQFRHGIKIYGSSTASLKNYLLEGNISFNNGAAGSQGFTGAWQFLIGGGSLVENITFDENFTYVTRRPIRDPDAGDDITYVAQQTNGQPLPAWLEFYGDQGFFEGTPSQADVGTIEIELTATDGDGESVTEFFNITVNPTNQPPTVIAELDDLTIRRNDAIDFDASMIFDDPEDDPLTYSLAPHVGGVNPSWISIDASTGVVTGTAISAGTIAFDVTAFDDAGNFSSAVFALTVNSEILVDLFPLNPFEAKLDGQWQGSVVGSDGKVYFASSTHAHNASGLFFQYDPGTALVTQIGPDLSTILGEDPTTQVPQGKLHSPIVESNGWLYMATYLANYWDEAQDAYTGSHLFGYELGSFESGTPNFVDFGIAIPRYTTYSAVAVSPDGQYVWSIVTPWATADVAVSGAHLFRTEIDTGAMQDFGQLTPDINAIQGAFAIHVDGRGDAWITMIGGVDRLFVGRAATGTIDVFAGALPAMTSANDPDELSAYQDGSWWRWGQSIDDERFLFTMYDSGAPFSERSGGSLWEFDASKTTDGDLSDAFREVAWIGGSNLGMTYSDGTVYFVRRNDGSHDPKINAVQGNGQYWDPNSDTGERLHLYSIRIDDPDSVITDWGRITDADGRVPWRIESISANTDTGEVYLSGDWVMLDTDPTAWRTLRHDGGTSTTYTLHIRGQAFSVAALPPTADLQVNTSDDSTSILPQETLTYSIEVTNRGPSAVGDTTVSDAFPPELFGVTWTAVGSGGASGFGASGTGSILDTGISLPAGASITYSVQATVADDAPHAKRLINTASAMDSVATDIDTTNNFSTDNDTIVIGAASRLLTETYLLTPYQETLDGQHQGSFVASDGKVYFASSTHAHNEAARLFQYDPATDTLTIFPQNLSEIVGEDPNTQVPQGMLRSITESDGWLYMDTHLANHFDEAQDIYTGGHLFGYQLGTLETGTPVYRNFGIPKARYSNYSGVDVSPDGQYLWTVATPFATADIQAGGTYVHRTHIETGVTEEFGPLIAGVTASQAAFGFHVDARGDAWITSSFGQNQLHVIRNDGTIESFSDVLPLMTDSNNPGQLAANQEGRWWQWNHQIDSERFLFTMFADETVPFDSRSGGSIWEFDTSKVVGNDFSNAFREVAWIGGHTLGMTYSDGSVYFVRRNDADHFPQIDAVVDGVLWDTYADGGVRLHLYSVDTNDPSGTITDHGMISDADGRVPWRIVSMSANQSAGEVYLTGDLVMKDDDPIQWKSYRHGETAANIYKRQIHGQAYMVAPITIPTGANLAVFTDDSEDPVTIGDDLTYSLTVNHFGPEPATNVVVTNTLPANVGFVSASPSCNEAGGIVTCSLGDMQPDDSVELEIVVTTNAIGLLENTAVVTSDTEDKITINNTAYETTIVNPVFADLVVTISDIVDPVLEGDDVTYQIAVTNDGPKSALNVWLTNPIPTGVVIASMPTSCADDGSTITCDLDDLASGSSANVDLVFTTTLDGQIVNAATATSDTQDPVAGNSTASETTVVNPLQADLVVTLSDDADPVLEGDHVTYTMTVANLGPNPATNVLITQILPATAVFVSTSSPSCTHDSGEITCNLAGMASGDSVEFEIEVATTIPDGMSSVATVTSDTLDPDSGNNSATETTQVDQILADLAVVLSDAEDRVDLGADITYQLAVTNNGPHSATGVVMTQTLPDGVLFVSATPPCTSAGGIVTCDLGTVNSGGVIDLSVVVTSTESGRLFSTASIASDTTDPDVSNNSVTQRTTVLGPPGSTDIVYVSFSSKGRVGDVPYADEDILAFDTTSGQWLLYFDGSQVGLGSSNVNAFHVEADGSILMSFSGNTSISGLDLVQDSDIVRFIPTAHGALTAGSFEWFLDGEDVGLAATSGDIDAISFTTDGRLVISGPSSLSLPGLAIDDEDLLVLNNGVFGAETSGDWEFYFDGSDIGLAGEHVWGSSIDGATGDVYVTTYNGFSASGISGDGTDILLCDPTTLGDDTVCDLSLWLDGSSQGIESGDSFDGIQIGSFTGNEVYGQEVIYMSTASNITVSGLAFRDEDIFIQDTRTGSWRMFFDGSDLGITTDVDGFHIMDDGSVLMSFNATTTAVGAGTVLPPDIVRFFPTSTGEETAGTFEMYFDGSDVELTSYYEDVDAIAIATDGGLLISTTGSFSVGGISGNDEDVLKFSGTSFGTDTAGSWEIYFDASDVELTASTEDINGLTVSPVTGQIHFTTLGSVSAGGVSGSGSDILNCTPGTLGDDTTCTMDFTYGGTNNGIIQALNGIHVFLPNELNGADVSVATNVAADPVVVGDNVTYQVTVFNNGPATADDVILTDILPTNAAFVSATAPCAEVAGTVTCDLGPITPGTSVPLDIVVATTVAGQLSNSATVSTGSEDPNSGNNSVTDTTDVNPVLADLIVSQSDLVDPATAGDEVTYRVTVTNDGPQPATNVVLTDVLPANTTFVSASPPCAEAGGTVTCDLGQLDAGKSVVLDIAVGTTQPGPLSNTASVSSDTADPNAGNNSETETTDVNPVLADLAVTQTDDADPVTIGDNVIYQITVTNNGPELATNVVLTNTLPVNVVFVSATPPCAESSGIVTCDLGNMAVGAVENIDIEVATTQAGQLSNLATASSDTPDAVGSNNSVTVSTEVLPLQADLVLTLSDAVDPVTAGDNITYNVTVTNNGPGTAESVVLTNTLPLSVSLVWPTGSCSQVGGVIACGLGDLDSGAAASFDIVVATSEPGPVTNVANVTSDTFDSVTSNDSVTVTTAVLGQPGSSEIIYVSFSTNGKVSDIPYSDEDILAFNTTTGEWLLYFDGSQVGLVSSDVNAFHIQADGSILLSFDANANINGLGLVRDSDIVKFTPTGHGVMTAGSFEWFFDGSDVGLSPTSGDLDAIGFTPDGRLVVSVPGNLNVPGFTAANDDLLVLNDGVFGADTSGNWAIYFDGSDVGLASSNIWGTSIDSATGDVHLTTQKGFAVGGVSGDSADILTCTLGAIGDDTSCSFNVPFDGSSHGIASGQSLDGIQLGSFTGTELFGREVIYMSTLNSSSINGFAVADEDIFVHDTRTGAMRMFFDGSDVGINTDVDAFDLQDDGSVLMSFNANTTIAGLGTVERPDIVRFIPTSTGEVTAGSFVMYFDGSDVGLTTYYEDIDAISFAPDGNLLISTFGGYAVDGVSGTDADLVKFIGTSFGDDTAGSWELFFDGSDVELTSTSEDIVGVSVNPTSGVIHFTTLGAVAAGGASGAGTDILTCDAGTLGNNTSCTMAFLYSGANNGITQSLDAIHVVDPTQGLWPAGGDNTRNEAPIALKGFNATPSSPIYAFQNPEEPLDVSDDDDDSSSDPTADPQALKITLAAARLVSADQTASWLPTTPDSRAADNRDDLAAEDHDDPGLSASDVDAVLSNAAFWPEIR